MAGIPVYTVPLLFSQERIQDIARRKFPGSAVQSAVKQHVPYWIHCYRFMIPRIFMKPRPMDIWMACDALGGQTFPIRIDEEVIREEMSEDGEDIQEPRVDTERASEDLRAAAYNAFVKRYLAMREPKVDLIYNKLVYFPMWKAAIRKENGTMVELVINGRNGIIEPSRDR